MSDIILEEQAASGTPSTGQVVLYPKSDGLLYSKDDAGAEVLLSRANSSSPTFAGATFTGPVGFPDGTAAAPSVKVGDEQNGLYSPSANVLGIATAGTQRVLLDGAGNATIGSNGSNAVLDQINAPRALLVQKADTSTTLGGSTAAAAICNADTTTSNTAQLNFAAITGASTNQYSSAIISCIFGARTNAQYPTGSLAFLTSTSLNSAPSEKMRLLNTGALTTGSSVGAAATGFTTSGDITLPVSGGIRSRSTFSAWVRHNAAGTVTRALNVDSVTKNATGDFTANITSSVMADGSYGFMAMTSATTNNVAITQDSGTAPSATAFKYKTSGVDPTGDTTVGFLP